MTLESNASQNQQQGQIQTSSNQTVTQPQNSPQQVTKNTLKDLNFK